MQAINDLAKQKNNPIIFDRLKLAKENHQNSIYSSSSGAGRRQCILSSNADSLTDEDLICHRDEMRVRKLFKYVTLVAPPLALFFFKYPRSILLLSLIPSYAFSHLVYQSNMISNHCDYSYYFIEKSRDRHFNKILKYNHLRLSVPTDVFHALGDNSEKVLVKDWVAKNRYS